MYFEYIHSEIIDDRIDAQFFTPEYIKSLKKINQFRIETLGNISRRIFDPPHTAPEFVDKSDFEMIMIENITLNGIEGNFRAISETCHKDIFKNSHLEGNELLVSRVGNSSGTFASVFPCYKGKNVSGNISIIKLKDEIIDKEYAFAYFNSNIGQNSIKRNIANTARKFLTISKIREFQVPIPSPEIQKYIGDKVRKAEELREEAKRLKKEAETFLYEMIQLKPLNDFDKDMFSFVNSNYIDSERLDSEYYKTKYITLEKLLKSKKVTSFKDIIIESKYGASVPADYTMVGIPFIRGNNLTDNEINIDDIVYLNKKLKDEVKDHHVNTGDILITRSGTVGISAVVDEKCDGFSFGSFMIKLRIDMRIWNPYYIAAFLNSFWGKWQIERLQNGAVQQNINLQEIGRIIIPIISKENQDKIEELIKNYVNKKRLSKQLIQEAKQDVEDLIEGNFDMSKVRANS